MTRSIVFIHGRSQAVRLPKAVALPEGVREAEIIRLGRSRLISPAGHSWDAFFEGPPVAEDFMSARGRPKTEPREPL